MASKTPKTQDPVRESYYDHAELESAILKYQDSLVNRDVHIQEAAFQRICNIYHPREYIPKWYSHYKHLSDSAEDFEQDYMRVFCTTLAAWKPRHLRKPSRYGGKGHFQNFFWGALSHFYINGVKSEAAAKRNLPQQCPLCNDWSNPLSTHLINNHIDLLWTRIEEMGYAITTLKGCPFCRSFKVPKGSDDDEAHRNKVTEALKKHMVSMHSKVLFETFHEKFPDHITVSAKALSVHGFDSAMEEETNIYETFESKPGIDNLLALNLTDVQRVMVEKILNDGHIQLTFDSSYNCSKAEFDLEFEGLQDALIIAGFEAGS